LGDKKISIPDFQAIVLPLLEIAGGAEEHSVKDARNRISDQFQLTEEERTALFHSWH